MIGSAAAYIEVKNFVTGKYDDNNPTISFLNKMTGSNYKPKIYWPREEKKISVDSGEHWIRMYYSEVNSMPRSLSGEAKYINTVGIIIVQVFLSKQSYSEADRILLCEKFKQMFVKSVTPSNVYLNNGTIKEVDSEDLFHRSNVTAEFEFDSAYPIGV